MDFFLEPMVASVDYQGPQEVIIISEDPVGPCFTVRGEGCFFFFLFCPSHPMMNPLHIVQCVSFWGCEEVGYNEILKIIQCGNAA